MKQYQKLQVDCTPSVPARKTRRMASILEPLVLILVPATLAVCAVWDYQQAAFAVFFLSFERSKPALRQIMPTVVFAALAAAGRIIFAPIPDFKPVSATCIIAGATFGRQSGFMVGALAALVSNFFFGQGAWTPWQMFAFGMIGFLAGILYQKGILKARKTELCIYGFLSVFLIYGGIMNPASALTWVGELNEKVLLTYYISGLPFDCIQAAATWLFLWFGAEPMLEKLDRIKVKYGMVEV